MDDARIYTGALTAEDVRKVMMGILPGGAFDPYPADEATDVPRDVDFSWTPGEYASPDNGHKFYLGEDFNDVNNGIDGITLSDPGYFPAQRLDFGTTYYWLVDEVNGPPDYAVHQGKVWSFTTELYAYPIENITAKASSANRAEVRPENTINGSGLDDRDLHSKKEMDGWLSGDEPTGAWIEYEFDKVYTLYEMWVWNSNQSVGSFLGYGFRDVTIEYSTNGTDYITLGTTHEFARAPGTDGYAHNTTIDFGSVVAKYVRLTAINNWEGIMPQYGLSKVRSYQIPLSARNPYLDSGATDVDVDATLSWRSGRQAATHDVYLSTDEQAVIDGSALVANITDTSYIPLALDLDMDYYWKIDEVNEAEIPMTWESNIWSFKTSDHIVVDNFESYNDLNPDVPESNRIFLTYIGGDFEPTNSSQVGHDSFPFAETLFVHDGRQSMPFYYFNAGNVTNSEAVRTFTAVQDWTNHKVNTLRLWFYGKAGNTGQLYVKINGFEIPYDGAAGDIAFGACQSWDINLTALEQDLHKVSTLAIGINGNGVGILYFDDIGLYP